MLSWSTINNNAGSSFVFRGIYQTISGMAGLTTPLILVFVGYNISLSREYLKRSIRIVLLRFAAALAVGYILKLSVIERFIPDSLCADAAFFFLVILPPVFALPILTADSLEKEELISLNNTLVFHSLLTIMMFAIYSFIYAVID